jgi:hypothetical protein
MEASPPYSPPGLPWVTAGSARSRNHGTDCLKIKPFLKGFVSEFDSIYLHEHRQTAVTTKPDAGRVN